MNCMYLPTVNNNNIYNYFGPRRPCQCHQTIRDRLRPGNMTLQSTVGCIILYNIVSERLIGRVVPRIRPNNTVDT